MSVEMQLESAKWTGMEQLAQESTDLSAVEVQALLCNIDQKNVVPRLREAQATIGTAGGVKSEAAAKRRAALALQEQWNGWLVEREVLREEIKRGKEFLERVREDIAGLRLCMEDWPAYERECGKNPLFHYMQSLRVKEGIEKFLPDWLERRNQKLRALDREMEFWARENGIENLAEV